MSKKQHLEEMFAAQLDERGVPYERELMLIPGRRFRWDFVVPMAGLAIEVNGGTWMGGRGGHSSGKGIQRDYEKANLATEYGWAVILLSGDMVKNGSGADNVVRYMTAYCGDYSLAVQSAAFAIGQGGEQELPAKTKRTLRKAKRRQSSRPPKDGGTSTGAGGEVCL